MSRPDRIIPVAKLSEGLRLCAQNIRGFIFDAQNLLSKGHGWHSIALAIFAFEELGKYDELLRVKESAGIWQDKVNVKDSLFRSHEYKQKFARKLIPKETMILSSGTFDKAIFDSNVFDTEDITPSDILRLQCVYVDWIDDDWTHGTPHDPQQLKRFLDAIIDALNKLETKTSLPNGF